MKNTVCVQDVISRQVELTPSTVAVIDENRSVSYRELWRFAGALAYVLRERGIGPDMAVALLAERSLEAVAAILGILRAGGAYVPINPRDPDDRMLNILDDARPQALVVQPHLCGRLGRRADDAIRLDIAALENLPSVPTLGASSDGEHLAVIVYTSGTTGKPKGVEIPHRAIIARARNGYPPRSGDLQKAPLTVVAHFSDLLLPLLNGQTVIIVPEDDVRSGSGLLSYVRRHRTTRLVFVPSQLAALLEAGAETADAFRLVDTVIVSGEPLTPSLVSTFKQWLPHTTLVNAYGASEVAGLACLGEVVSANDITVGTAVPGCIVELLDEDMQDVPTGHVGEVYFGGAQLAKGYRSNPTLSRERFVAHPRLAGERLYRTGDLAERLPDGRLRVLGRRDLEVKVHGYRVNLIDIERVLEEITDVERAVVVFDGDDVEQRLTAYVVARSGHDSAAPGRFRAYVAARLPSHMVPTRIHFIAGLPFLPNGKIDRVALRALAANTVNGPHADTTSSQLNASERTIAALWSELLNVPQVTAEDDFFSLGGDSIQAMRFVVRAASHGLSVTLAQLVEAPTVAGLARLVTQSQRPGRVADDHV